MNDPYYLVNGVAQHESYPNYKIPSQKDKTELKVGDNIRLHAKDEKNGERFYVTITEIRFPIFFGVVDSDIKSFSRYFNCGSILRFIDDNIVTIFKEGKAPANIAQPDKSYITATVHRHCMDSNNYAYIYAE